jgi:CO/xanthine dehydrogenase Mo-binding subunit
MEYQFIGRNLLRKDAAGKVTGETKYSGDVVLPGFLVGKILRSPYTHARIMNIDTNRASALPGVKAVITHEDTSLMRIPPIAA